MFIISISYKFFDNNYLHKFCSITLLLYCMGFNFIGCFSFNFLFIYIYYIIINNAYALVQITAEK